MAEGWIKLHRSIMENRLWKGEKFTRGQAWVDMLMLANWEDGSLRIRGIDMPIRRGQLGWSEVKLAERWNWSRNKVRRFLGELKTKHQIEQQNGNVSSLITIVNYEEYQNRETDSEHQTKQQVKQQTEQQKDSKRNTNKKNKNNKKEKKTSCAERVEAIYNEYPRKIGRGAAEKAIANALEKVDFETLMGKVFQYSDAVSKWPKDRRRFAPHPSTWFNQERWKDDPQEWEYVPEQRNDSKPKTDSDGRTLMSDAEWQRDVERRRRITEENERILRELEAKRA